MKFRSFAAAAAIILSAASCGGRKAPASAPEPEIPPIGFRAEDYMHDVVKVKKGETFVPLMVRAGLSKEDAQTLAGRCADSLFSFRKMRYGDVLDCYYSGDSLARIPEYVVYNHDKITKTVFKCADSLYMWKYVRPTELLTKCCDVTIRTSLWQDMHDSGAPTELVPELADIYAWSVNFFGLKEGDRFQTVYTSVWSEGELIRVKSIDFCRYTSGKYIVNAIYLPIKGVYDKYYTEDGRSLRKAFLKAPLKYNRVSSKFTYHRKHPVTGKVKPHTGVDYAAPSGTPVHSLGDGTVTSAGWTRTGGGNVVRIKHSNGYETGYLHLRGFAKGIKAGVKVKQGQTIGYVGSTGVSTGPHLDFRVWKNGKPIDPLKMVSPPAQPLPQAYRPQLDSLYSRYSGMLDACETIE